MFIGQIYAPVGDLDRSLYLYVCNTRQCSLQSSGWIVIRNQKQRTATTVAIEAATGATSATSTKINKAASDWSFLSEDTPTMLERSTAESLGELEALLYARDLSNTAQRNLPPMPSPVASTSSKKETAFLNSDENCRPLCANFNCWLLDDMADPYVPSINSEEDGTTEDEYEYDDESNDHGDHEKLAKMLEDYLACEEDSEIVATLRQHATIAAPQKKKSSSSVTKAKKALPAAALPAAAAPAKATTSRLRRGGTEGGGSYHDSDSTTSANEDARFSRTDTRSRIEREFQRTVALEPRQVLRYEYGGDPLWCTFPFPNCSTLPQCECCGSSRVFELQLMPNLLNLLSASSASDGTTSNTTAIFGNHDESLVVGIDTEQDIANHAAIPDAAADDDELAPVFAKKPSPSQLRSLLAFLGEGFDFGVAAVYSCPSSCRSESLSSTPREFVVVQPPADIGL